MYFKSVNILNNLRAFYSTGKTNKKMISAVNSLFGRKDDISIDPVIPN